MENWSRKRLKSGATPRPLLHPPFFTTFSLERSRISSPSTSLLLGSDFAFGLLGPGVIGSPKPGLIIDPSA